MSVWYVFSFYIKWGETSGGRGLKGKLKRVPAFTLHYSVHITYYSVQMKFLRSQHVLQRSHRECYSFPITGCTVHIMCYSLRITFYRFHIRFTVGVTEITLRNTALTFCNYVHITCHGIYITFNCVSITCYSVQYTLRSCGQITCNSVQYTLRYCGQITCYNVQYTLRTCGQITCYNVRHTCYSVQCSYYVLQRTHIMK